MTHIRWNRTIEKVRKSKKKETASLCPRDGVFNKTITGVNAMQDMIEPRAISAINEQYRYAGVIV